MLSKIFDKVSFYFLSAVIILLPIFFLPFSKIPAETSKGFLLVIGLSFAIIFWLIARLFDRKIIIPRSKVLLLGFVIVFITLISAIFSSSIRASFFGTMLDTGSFYFILSAFLLLFFSSLIINDHKNARLIFIGVFFSIFVSLIFQIFHLFLPRFLSLGILLGKTDTLVGSFNSFGLLAGLAIVISIFVFSFLSFSKTMKYLLGLTIIFSIFFLILINFSIAWVILGVIALLVFIYKISFLSNTKEKEENKNIFTLIPFIIVIISLFFLLGGSSIGGFLSNKLNVSNMEIRPSLSSTLTVAKGTLAENPIFGSGPNTFFSAWNLYKPAVMNDTNFWNSSFESGFGLVPTFMINTGSLGTLAWILFLISILILGFKFLVPAYKEGAYDNWEVVLYFIMSFYILIAAFFYAVSASLLLSGFAFLGVFIGLSRISKTGENKDIEITFLKNSRKNFIALILLIAIILLSVTAGFKYIQRFVSIPYFQKAISSNSIESAELNINKALSLYINDLYLRTYAQVYILKFNSISSSKETLTDAKKAELKNSFDLAIQSAELAKKFNETNYLNSKFLGMVYESFIPFGVQNADSMAIESYKKASELSPLNPETKLSIARVYANSGKFTEAKEYANQAFSLKKDYIDAILMISQISKKQGNNSEAMKYAQLALSYDPQNKQLIQYADSLEIQGTISSGDNSSTGNTTTE